MSHAVATRQAAEGFDFTRHMRALCGDMVARLPELSHIDLPRVAICFAQARNGHGHGLQATLTPMRFEGGSLTTIRRGRKYAVQRLYDSSGRESLYILTFYLPRFLNHPLSEKINTVIHELWHINPEFNGDLRRFSGRCYAHGHSQQAYDAAVEALAARWWSAEPPPAIYGFLGSNFAELVDTHGHVVGLKLPNPKLIPVDAQFASLGR